MSNEFSLPPDARARQQMLDQKKSESELRTDEAHGSSFEVAASMALGPRPPANRDKPNRTKLR